MKTCVIILIVLLSSCGLPKRIIENKYESYVTSVPIEIGSQEDPNNPGVFFPLYDTINVKIKFNYDLEDGYRVDFPKTTYKLLKK